MRHRHTWNCQKLVIASGPVSTRLFALDWLSVADYLQSFDNSALASQTRIAPKKRLQLVESFPKVALDGTARAKSLRIRRLPHGFPTGKLNAGDIVVSNFNDSAHVQGIGTTMVGISPSGQQSLVFPGPVGLGLYDRPGQPEERGQLWHDRADFVADY